MELSYWQSRWRKGNTGFHLDDTYPGLIKHWKNLGVGTESTVMVPLCGKSKDLYWLSSKVKKVIGVEVSKIAINQFLSEHSLHAENTTFGSFDISTTGNIELWCGDFNHLPENKFQDIDLIYDKAALVALPETFRFRYARKLKGLGSNQTKVLIHHFEYVQEEMNGPPFSVPPKEISGLFGDSFFIRQLEMNTLDIKKFKKFLNRGLKSHLIEYLSLLSREENN